MYVESNIVSFAIDEGRVALFDPVQDKIIVINQTGFDIWTWMKECDDMDRFISEYSIKYNVEEYLLRKDVEEFVSKLYELGFCRNSKFLKLHRKNEGGGENV